MKDVLINVGMAVTILGLSFFITNWYARAYVNCRQCKTMNAKRRTHCRNCGAYLRGENGPPL